MRLKQIKTLVIHPYDPSTEFLTEIYLKKDWTRIHNNISHSKLVELIKSHDRIVMLGHGTEQGLLGHCRFIINSTLVYLLRDKYCVCIWCNADEFVKKYGLRGFYTGMIISEYGEAMDYAIPTTPEWIAESNKDFALAIKESIDSDNMLETAKSLYEGNTSVVEFNRNHLYQSE